MCTVYLLCIYKYTYRRISTNYNMVTCQSDNQLKTPAKVSWVFKMVSQFGSLGDTIMGKTADLTVVQKTIIDTLHKEDKTQTFITKEAVHRVLYPSMLTESWVEGKRCTTNRENRSLMRIVKQNRFKNSRTFTKPHRFNPSIHLPNYYQKYF